MEQQQMQQAITTDQLHTLLQQVEELEDFRNHANVALRCINANGVIVWANQAELDLLGHTATNYIGSAADTHHVQPAVVHEMMTTLERDGVLTDYPCVLKRADGSQIEVLINSSIYRKNGEFVHTRCITRDVTALTKEKEQDEALLRESAQNEHLLNMALDAAAMGTWDYQIQTGQLYCSNYCKEILGFGINETINPALLKERILPADFAALKKDFETAISQGERVISNFSIYKNEELRFLQAQGKIYLSKTGQPQRFFGTLVDTTEATLATESAAKLAAIIESSDDAIISKSLNSIVTSWNPSAERIFGYTAQEMIGESITILIPEDRLEEEPQIIAKLKNGERVDHFETIRRAKNGKLLDISLTISPIKNAQGEIVGVSKIARDITQQKREQVRKNDFVAMVSHELKTPLTSITGYIQLIMRMNKQTQNEFMSNALVKTDAQLKKMSNMIHDFLNLSRLEEGRIHLHKTIFEFMPLAEEVLSNLQLFTPSHTLVSHLPPNIYLYGDREKIGQVLTNLLSNAIKYSPPNTTVTLSGEITDQLVRIAVIDEGIGISAADQIKLFERFYRVDQAGPGQPSGFGIGLYLASELMRMHHTEIKVQSELGKGATFYFDLPIQTAP